ncbi:MAG: ATP-binding protein [Butyrivibrio sp.]|nr:ATP-binding protein [Butyrivibrio sp.]
MKNDLIYDGKSLRERSNEENEDDFIVTSFKLTNFKAFSDSGWIDLNKLTILMGKNSVGKSSITQAIQMVKVCYDSIMQGRIQPGLLVLQINLVYRGIWW